MRLDKLAMPLLIDLAWSESLPWNDGIGEIGVLDTLRLTIPLTGSLLQWRAFALELAGTLKLDMLFPAR